MLCTLAIPSRVEGEKDIVYVVLDNLDQVDLAGQEEVLKECLYLLGRRATEPDSEIPDMSDMIRVYKIVLPLRPETMLRLQNRLDPCSQKHVVVAGEVDHDLALARRGRTIREAVLASHRQIDREVSKVGYRVYVPVWTVVAARQAE